jgi:hypothetical protein
MTAATTLDQENGNAPESIDQDVDVRSLDPSAGGFQRRGLVGALGALVIGLAAIGRPEEASAAPLCCGPSKECPSCTTAGTCSSKGCRSRVGECNDPGNISRKEWYCCDPGTVFGNLYVLCRDWYSVNGATCNCAEYITQC